jgi:hypothetical protein
MTHMSDMTHFTIESKLRAHALTLIMKMRHSASCVMATSSSGGHVVITHTILGIDSGALELPIVFLTLPRCRRVADIPALGAEKTLAHSRNRPVAVPSRSVRPKVRCRPL